MIYSNTDNVLDIATFCYKELNLTKEIHIEVKDLEVDGYCYSNGLVEINKDLNQEDMEIAICHELVHCAQYEQQGRACEVEAYEKETKLWRKYVRQNRKRVLS